MGECQQAVDAGKTALDAGIIALGLMDCEDGEDHGGECHPEGDFLHQPLGGGEEFADPLDPNAVNFVFGIMPEGGQKTTLECGP